MTYIASILISLAVLFSGFYGIANYATLGDISALSTNKEVGVSLLTISSATKISDLATILPANFNALNSGKIEVSTTTLPLLTTTLALSSVGTITTGTWNATAIAVSKGGTGTTTPSQWLVLLGNGTAGITVASSTGTTGQFLTSNGAGAYPSWTSSVLDTAINYTWTGGHYFNASTTFNATTTIAASSVLSNALVLNGLAYKFPTSYNASSTVLSSDGAGNLTWQKPSWVYASSSTVFISADTERSGSSVSYIKVKEIAVAGEGIIAVKFDLNCTVGNTAYATIYKNGSAAGTERSVTGAVYATFYENITVKHNDLIQIYIKSSSTYYVKNFQLMSTDYEFSTVITD